MKCPICKTEGITETINNCPNCHSDLEGFRLTGSLEKSFKQRLYFGIIASILFIAVLLIWIVSDVAAKNEQTTELQSQTATEQSFSQKQLIIEQDNANLEAENAALKKQLLSLNKEQEKREKKYIIQPGESLYFIARKVYGNGYKYVDLARDNNIAEPGKVRAGQELIIYY